MSEHPYDHLTPDLIMDAVESAGLICDGRLLVLNSYENRVYQVGIEDETPLIAKFYRPERWSDDQILEEHAFCAQLVEQDLPVVPPLVLGESTLARHADFRFALFARRGGRGPELDDLDNLYTLGKYIGRIHQVGRTRPFEHRPRLDVQTFGEDAVGYIREHMIPADLAHSYNTLTDDLLTAVRELLDTLEEGDYIRVHGDCHAGNILWRDDRPNFVDFDDARMAPAVQDIWMLLSGDRQRQLAQLAEVLEGYSQFCDFDPRQLRWAEALRTLRLLHFSAWLGRRWQDPAFPRAFPWFNTPRYWGEHILELREQLAVMGEEPLRWL